MEVVVHDGSFNILNNRTGNNYQSLKEVVILIHHCVVNLTTKILYLLQRLYIAIQMGNAAAMLRTARRGRIQDPFWKQLMNVTVHAHK